VDPSKKRKIRLVVALGLAVLLGAALIWTSFSAASEARTPSEVLAAPTPGKSFDMTGTVVAGSIERRGDAIDFEVRDRDGTAAVPVTFDGLVPDPFREGREVIVTGTVSGGTFHATELITKCPSKFTSAEESS
jgi:cytochrome c-type biogenesis protein CcmE